MDENKKPTSQTGIDKEYLKKLAERIREEKARKESLMKKSESPAASQSIPSISSKYLNDDDDEEMASEKTAIIDLAALSGHAADAKLTIVDGKDAGKSIEITKDEILAGRHLDNDFVISDPSVSRKHFKINKEGDSFIITDMGSGNGIAVNGTKVTTAELTDSAIIAVGARRIRFDILNHELKDKQVNRAAKQTKPPYEEPAKPAPEPVSKPVVNTPVVDEDDDDEPAEKKSHAAVWVIVIILLAAAAGAAYYFTSHKGSEQPANAAPAAQNVNKAEPKKEEPKAEAKAEEPKKEEPKAEAKAEEPKKEEPKAEAKAEEPKKEEPKAEAKAEEPKKEEPKAEAKAEEPKKEEVMAEPKKEEKKAEPKKAEPKKEEKKAEPKKAEPKKEEKKAEPKKAEPKKAEPKKNYMSEDEAKKLYMEANAMKDENPEEAKKILKKIIDSVDPSSPRYQKAKKLLNQL